MKQPHCQICDELGHYAMNCPRRINKPIKTSRQLKSMGKYSRKSHSTRKKWLREHLPDHSGYYYCSYCGKALTTDEMTLDHIKSRSRHPELRYELTNLTPSCYPCNGEKGSREQQIYFA